MHRKVFLALVVVCCLAVPAFATITITAGNHVLAANTSGQIIQILISSNIGQAPQGVDLALSINGGVVGPINAVNGPIMDDVIDMDSVGTTFGDAAGGNSGDNNFEAAPTRDQFDSIVTLAGDASLATGILANVSIDTTGILATGVDQVWSLDLFYNGFGLDAGSSSIPAQATTLVNGELRILGVVPEPSSILLGLFAAAGFGIVAVRRHRRRRVA